MFQQVKIGLIREGKVPPDKRVAFTPRQVEEILQRFPQVTFAVEPSDSRCYSSDEYVAVGASLQSDLTDCDILMGIKEVPIDRLIPNKTYIFFSHTIKKQPYNRELLRNILSKGIRLIDYETLTDNLGNRLVAFGRYAGIVGAYNGLMAWGLHTGSFRLKRAMDCFDVNDLKIQLHDLHMADVRIVLTGAGRVARGAMETLDSAGIRKVSPADFLQENFQGAVYVQLNSEAYHERIAGGHFNREEFHQHPELYRSTFGAYLSKTDVLMAGAYWNPKAPVLFHREDILRPDFSIRVIADITCDIGGSVPTTVRASSIAEPFYDYLTETGNIAPPFCGKKAIHVMAVDNLPCELPRSASEEFGRDLIDRIFRPLLGEDHEGVIERATLTKDGALTSGYAYLQDYVAGK